MRKERECVVCIDVDVCVCCVVLLPLVTLECIQYIIYLNCICNLREKQFSLAESVFYFLNLPDTSV